MYNFYNELNYRELKKDEIDELFKNRQDKKTRDYLIKNNLKLVIKVIYKYQSETIELDDLINIGSIGLIKAVDTFDINKKITFSTYAARCINNEVLMYLRKNKKTNISIDEKIDDDENSCSLLELIDDPNINIEESCINKEVPLIIEEILSNLVERDKNILKLYYGFYNDKRYTQSEIAHILGISSSHVSKIINKSLQELRTNPNCKKLLMTLY